MEDKELETPKKLKISSYTERKEGKKTIKEHHEDIISDEYWSEHKNFDGSILKTQVKIA